MKKCPFCAEEIQDEAIKCKHCNEFLNTPQVEKEPWYLRTSVIIMAFLGVGPLALPLVWWHPKIAMVWKIVITLITCVLSWYLYKATMASVQVLMEQYKILSEL